MNGGSQGALHISAPWGDPQLAGLFGSSAVADGSAPYNDVLAAMMEEPEAFFAPDTMALAAQRGTCDEKCKGLSPIDRAVCMVKCRSAPSAGGALEGLIRSVGVAAVAVGLIIVGALALTK